MTADSWRVDVLCAGCSQWVAPDGTPGSIDPAKNDIRLAYAATTVTGTVADPTSNTSAFSLHSTLGAWEQDFTKSKLANFDTVVAAKAAAPAAPAAPATAPAARAEPAFKLITGRRRRARQVSVVPEAVKDAQVDAEECDDEEDGA